MLGKQEIVNKHTIDVQPCMQRKKKTFLPNF